MHRLRKLARLSSADLRDLLHAQWALIHAQVLRWICPVGEFVSPVAPTPASAPESARVDEDLVATAARPALAIRRAAENGIFRPRCLVRAVALARMLESRGISGSQLRVGIRWRGGKFAAHAWIEYRGRILGDVAEHVKNYIPLMDMRLLRPDELEHQDHQDRSAVPLAHGTRPRA
ncbi:MAG TPA: lasso peptide biosynthesis B2 protein [Longimicrobiaceae bacterium]|nr:lasso peptide biosynthesis B2 protein [Longimicrobiaceae bacterium]